VDESKFPEPQWEPLPGDAPALPSPDAPVKSGEKPAASGGSEEAADQAAEEAADESQEPPAAGSEQETAAEDKQDEAKPKKTDSAPATEKSASEPGDKAPADAAADKSAEPAAADGQPAPASEAELLKKKLDAERERIVKENQRKRDEWNEKKRTAQGKVQELNDRFADWYYVISEDVYKKLHLGRSDVVTGRGWSGCLPDAGKGRFAEEGRRVEEVSACRADVETQNAAH
jgi:hypothetical protein